MAHIRNRKRWAFLKPLLFILVAGALIVAVGPIALRELDGQGLLDRLKKKASVEREGRVGLGRGFHILDDDYWVVFDDASLLAKPVVKAPSAKPGEAKIDAEGLTVHPMKVKGPYYIVGDMGGLVPSAVGIWASPVKLGQGREAFYGEPGEEVEVTHWVRNFGGFKVYRVLNKKKRPGPGNKMYEAGWLLGIYLKNSDGEAIK